MRVFIGSDHGGFRLKEVLKIYLDSKGYEVHDVGNNKLVPTDDYPDFAVRLIKKLKASNNSRGILICRNGVGVSIAANKHRGIRAVLTDNIGVARTSRADDDTNILCLGQDFITAFQAKKVTEVWLKTKYSGAVRHKRRLKKVQKIERNS